MYAGRLRLVGESSLTSEHGPLLAAVVLLLPTESVLGDGESSRLIAGGTGSRLGLLEGSSRLAAPGESSRLATKAGDESRLAIEDESSESSRSSLAIVS